MNIRHKLAAVALAAILPLAAACSTGTTEATGTTITSTTTSSTTTESDSDTDSDTGPRGGGPGGVDVDSVTTEAELVTLVQDAYGDPSLDLHRGHQPVQDVLDDVLSITHDELHVRMDSGQNLADVATDIGVDPQTLVDALVESRSPAIDSLLASGEITEPEAEQYRAALEDAFEFRVSWDGEAATPTFSGLA